MRYFFLEWVNDFEITMLDDLAREYPVSQITRIMRRYKSVNKLILGVKLKRLHKRLHCAIRLSGITKEDVAVCNGYSVFPFLDYLSTMPCKKVLILRDSVEALTRKRRLLGHLAENQDYIETVRPVFSAIFSFDPEDCQKYRLIPLKQFLPFSWHRVEQMRKNPCSVEKKCFFVGGYDQHRVETINALTPVLQENSIGTDFYLWDKLNNHQSNYPQNCKNKKLSYQQNIEGVCQSHLLLEINKPGQAGLTLRALEAAVFQKKLITTNLSIKDMDIYDPSRVFIFDGSNANEVARFITRKIQPVTDEVLQHYCSDAMLTAIKQHI